MGKDFTKWPMPTLVIVKFVRHQREGDEPTSRGAIFRPVRTASNSPRRGLLPVPQAASSRGARAVPSRREVSSPLDQARLLHALHCAADLNFGSSDVGAYQARRMPPLPLA